MWRKTFEILVSQAIFKEIRMSAESLVTFTERKSRGAGRIGYIRLQNQKALNSLTLDMVKATATQLAAWEADPSIAVIVIHSDLEKAFCAGGDVKTVALRLRENPSDPYPAEFFKWEYKMDHMIHACAKPVLAWGDGIVMGGGMGLFCAASHGVVTERSVLAMPEISIGFFPDVGAGYFLNRLPRGAGLFLAWTAARLSAADAVHLHLAKTHIPSGLKAEVFKALETEFWSAEPRENGARLTTLLSSFGRPAGESVFAKHEPDILRIFSQDTGSEVRRAFLARVSEDSWWISAQRAHLAGSNLSAHVVFEHLKRAKELSRLDVFAMEWSLARQFSARGEFVEGVRALLIDKDSQPKWKPAKFEDVRGEDVFAHFEPAEGLQEIREFFAFKGV